MIELCSKFNGKNNGDLCATWSFMKERGWKTVEMVQRDAHLSAEKLVEDAQRIVTQDTSTPQSLIAV